MRVIHTQESVVTIEGITVAGCRRAQVAVGDSSKASVTGCTLNKGGHAGVDNDDDCAFERACEWKRFAIIVHSTCTGTKRTSVHP